MMPTSVNASTNANANSGNSAVFVLYLNSRAWTIWHPLAFLHVHCGNGGVVSRFPYWSTGYGCNIGGVVAGARGVGLMAKMAILGRGMMAGAQGVLINDCGHHRGTVASVALSGKGKGNSCKSTAQAWGGASPSPGGWHGGG